ncbi:MAG: aquaporin [Phycisphaerales bacterium]|nr:aquaporin [Phycisphaerales bacterium]MCI0629239.1 aquaporin [Phycisphaerales bacterium]MCI0675880.1 aquaporin [Phycisphaerales bacterium]
MNKLVAEFIGTFALVFAGAGAIIINGVSDGAVTHVGIALTFGLVVMVMVMAIGDVSGAHINPAVTIAFWASRRFPAKSVGPYVAAQVAGAFAASIMHRLMFPEDRTLGATTPNGSDIQSFVLEFFLTAILMFVILMVTTGSKEKGLMAGIAIGGAIGLDAMFGGPISGASMNPARSLAPAVISGRFGSLWLYLAAPVSGALAAIPCWRLAHQSKK